MLVSKSYTVQCDFYSSGDAQPRGLINIILCDMAMSGVRAILDGAAVIPQEIVD